MVIVAVLVLVVVPSATGTNAVGLYASVRDRHLADTHGIRPALNDDTGRPLGHPASSTSFC